MLPGMEHFNYDRLGLYSLGMEEVRGGGGVVLRYTK